MARIEPGKLADLTVLSADIMKIPESEILKAICAMNGDRLARSCMKRRGNSRHPERSRGIPSRYLLAFIPGFLDSARNDKTGEPANGKGPAFALRMLVR